MEENTQQSQEGVSGDAPATPPQTQQVPQPSTPTPEMSIPEAPASEKSYGPIVGIIVILILLIGAGLYFWGENLEEKYANDTATEVMEEETPAVETVPAESEDAGSFDDTPETPVSESDEIADLEADLDNTEIEELDAELESIDAELDF